MNHPGKKVHIVKPPVCVAVWISSLHGCGGHRANLQKIFLRESPAGHNATFFTQNFAILNRWLNVYFVIADNVRGTTTNLFGYLVQEFNFRYLQVF